MPNAVAVEERSSPSDAATPLTLSRAGTVVAAVLGAAAAVQIVIGAVWWVVDLTALPSYGDTFEYLQLAQSLHVDAYRTILYPAMLHVADGASAQAHIPVQTVMYLVQTAVLVAACAFLVSTVWRVAALTAGWSRLAGVRPRTRRGILVFATAVTVTTPLGLHYADSVLADSLAASLTITSVAAVIRVAAGHRRLLAVTLCTVPVAAAAELMRSEKLYLVVAVCAITLIGIVAVRPRRWLARSAALLVVLVVPAAIVHEVDAATQTANYGRAPLTLDTVLFDRSVWPRLEQIRPTLSPTLQAVITPQLARQFDEDPNGESAMILRLEAADGGRDVYVHDVTLAALRCCWPAITGDTALDGLKYAAPQVTTAIEWMLQSPTPTPYDIDKMAAAHPRLTSAFLWSSIVLFFAVLLPLSLLAAVRARGRLRGAAGAAAGVIACTVLVNAVMFAMLSAQPANIRYSLPAYLLLQACAVWGALAFLYAESARRALSSPRTPGWRSANL
jgi:hypothetical protein